MICICRCDEGYTGAHCQVAATSTSTELPLLVSLSTLLPIAAVLVVIIAIVSIYRRLKGTEEVISSHQQHRDTVRARYDASVFFHVRSNVLDVTQVVALSTSCLIGRLCLCYGSSRH